MNWDGSCHSWHGLSKPIQIIIFIEFCSHVAMLTVLGSKMGPTGSCIGSPEPPKLNSAGSKIGNTHHTRLRVGLSHLNAHMFQIQLTPSPACPCGYIQEDTAHYILRCPLYTYHRSQLFIKMRRIIPDFDNLSSKCKLSTLLFGINLTIKQGIRVAYHLQSYIGLTHRFNM